MSYRGDSGYKVFVGGLPQDCSDQELQMVFSTYGVVENVYLMPPKSDSGSRCAFVYYQKLESAEDAIQVLHGQYKIREDAEWPIQVKWPREKVNDWGAKGKGDFAKGQEAKGWSKGTMDFHRKGFNGGFQQDTTDYGGWPKGSEHSMMKGKKPDWSKGGYTSWDRGKGGEGLTLYVSSLPLDCSSEEVWTVFATYGEVRSVHLKNPYQGESTRSAYVTYIDFESAEDAYGALQTFYKIREDADRPIHVTWATSGGKGKGGMEGGHEWGGKEWGGWDKGGKEKGGKEKGGGYNAKGWWY